MCATGSGNESPKKQGLGDLTEASGILDILEYSLQSERDIDSLDPYYKEGGMMLCELLWTLEGTWKDPNTVIHDLWVIAIGLPVLGGARSLLAGPVYNVSSSSLWAL